MRNSSVEHVRSWDSGVDRFEASFNLRNHPARKHTIGDQSCNFRRCCFRNKAGLVIDITQQASDIGEINDFGGTERAGDRAGNGVGVDGVGLTAEIGTDGGNHGDEVLGQKRFDDGGSDIGDIADETKPKVLSDLRLEVHNPEHFAAIADDPGAAFIGQGYAGHYCNIPTRVNPDIVACSMIVSGLRVFDIRDPAKPKEIAYFNPPLQPRITPYLEASGYAMASPSFVPARKEIWYSDVYSGFYVVRLTNGVW